MSLTGPQALELITNTTKPLVGQHLPEWADAHQTLNDYTFGLSDQPAILGIECRIGSADSTMFNQSHISVAKEHIQAGGIIGIAPHFPSPFGSDQTITGTWGVKGDHAQLLQNAPSSTAKTRWQGNIDRLNAIFDQLGDDAPVLFHPFHEGNGNWFWWGYNSSFPSRSNIGLANLYNDLMNRTHAVQRGYVRGFQAGMTWYAGVGHGFPGLANVDLVGSSLYRTSNTPLTFVNKFQDDYQALKAYGKPIMIWEGGPAQEESPMPTASWDANQMSDGLLTRYPDVKSTLMWHVNTGGFGPWNKFINGATAFNSPKLARLKDIAPSGPQPTQKTVYTALRNPVMGVYTSEEAAWAASDEVIAVVQSEVQE